MSQPIIDEAEALAVVRQLVESEQDGARLRPLILGPWSAYVLVSALQLVLRHPDYSDGGGLADIIEDDARQLVDLFQAEPNSPLPLALCAQVREILGAGFDRNKDVEGTTAAELVDVADVGSSLTEGSLLALADFYVGGGRCADTQRLVALLSSALRAKS